MLVNGPQVSILVTPVAKDEYSAYYSLCLSIFSIGYMSKRHNKDWGLIWRLFYSRSTNCLLILESGDLIFLLLNSIDDDESAHIQIPKLFCGHRSLENGSTISKVIEVLANLRNYVSHVSELSKSKLISSSGFCKMVEMNSWLICGATLDY